jgi:hypothetical protein
MATEPPHRLFRFRFLFLAGYLGLWAAIVYLVVFNDWLLDGKLELRDMAFWVVPLIILQTLFLLGAPHLRPGTTHGGRPMIVSLIVGALFATLLSAGIIASVGSLLGFSSKNLPDKVGPVLIVILLASWLAWLWIFLFFLVDEWTDRYRKLYRLLLAGTVLELAITIPIDASVRRRTQCYCNEGTFWALCIGIVSMLWILGPGVVLLFLARRMQRRKKFGYCRRCGYDLRKLPSNRCPECGTEFEVAK